ncbi:hypothetical protein VKS41_003415 [Umbelopsis sp. WA50703]
MLYVTSNMNSIAFKSLQRDEQERSDSEKAAYMNELLATDPSLFLTKWGRYLPAEQLEHFQPLRTNNYEIDVQMHRLLKELPSGVQTIEQENALRKKRIQNRRFQYLKNVLKDSEYFTESAMRLREPGLYEYYIGQHIPPHMRDQPYDNDVNLVQRIMTNIDRSIIDNKLRIQQQIGAEQEEEEEEEEEEGDQYSNDENIADADGDTNMAQSLSAGPSIAPLSKSLLNKSADAQKKLKAESENTATKSSVSSDSRQAFQDSQKDEYVRMMEELFLEGRDPTFDYSEVDDNEAYDDLDQADMDFQDKYFDEEEGDEENNANGTGEYDY